VVGHLALGGMSSRTALADYLRGTATWPVRAHDILAQTLNEALWELGCPSHRYPPVTTGHGRVLRRDGTQRVTSTPTRGGTIAGHHGRCAEAHLGCPCRGDETIHEERSRQTTEARARSGEPVGCPECGAATTPLAILAWGNCLACRTAQSRLTHPLRW
jgi:hypothetical protein